MFFVKKYNVLNFRFAVTIIVTINSIRLFNKFATKMFRIVVKPVLVKLIMYK